MRYTDSFSIMKTILFFSHFVLSVSSKSSFLYTYIFYVSWSENGIWQDLEEYNGYYLGISIVAILRSLFLVYYDFGFSSKNEMPEVYSFLLMGLKFWHGAELA